QEWLNQESRSQADHHLAGCEECRRCLENQAVLESQMRDLAAELERHEAPPVVEAALERAFAARWRRKPWPRWAYGAIGAAAAGLLAAGIFIGYEMRPAAPPVEPVAEFLPLRPGAVLNPGESGGVVRIRVPRAELVRFGLPYNPEAATQTVQADV